MTSKVYFTDFRAPTYHENPTQKLQRLLKTAGIGDIDFNGKYTAIKIHFGEPGNLAYLRPNWAKAVADVIRELGGRPFLTDCNTLYIGRRANALDHLEAAYENGYNPFTTGCHTIIADGLKGGDEVLVPVNGDFVKEAKIGKAIMEADVFITLSHFKGHEATGFGGTIKNIGMGCGSRAGKMEQHSDSKPKVSKSRCVGCGICEKWCAHDAIQVNAEKKAVLNQDKCVGCGRCLTHCPTHAVFAAEDATAHSLNCKMAEYTKAVVDGRPCFHISLVVDVSPLCDCYGTNDVPIVPDVGMFASFDPVALDQACADAVNALCPNPNSQLEPHTCDHDHFHHLHPDTDWQDCLDHCQKIGIGSRAYELVTI
ncbi:DUF362 domain-containing protein [Bengtsoniella intestinalis]|uniref:DUF362 domain-containing protein n=1 Tax=Bengtsoniella intestinalis TaxID=3073143 RepID=UPI00391F405F